MFRFISLLVFLFVTSPAYANINVTVEKVQSVYDADTFRVDISGWPDIVGKNIPIRVNGVDAAEIRGKCTIEKELARAARDYTKTMLQNGRIIELRNIQRGKYFRLLADVYVDGISLSEALIHSGHARPYDGGTRQGWCAKHK
ncbi:thermonuclease family protein [Marinomonas ostreistagni]|uniref:Thermonuclease family protein n=1 Tax=Marinomonas ostreistagni TaxID=359209 RepID=A0ABS0Z7I3_9GAMM|nr:thermonuclease family protein [Marinomonas ostreistagni]MBJ7549610.1 thermonuclease family protein [Marinomonas ostreistagni]